MKFLFHCNGCWKEEITYISSQLAAESRRHLVSLALSLSFFISGQGYASCRKALGKGLGLGVVSEKPFLEVVDLALPYIKEILEELCEDAKLQMKSISSDQLDTWDRARSSHVLKCDFHALAYQIECAERAKEAEKVICQNPHLLAKFMAKVACVTVASPRRKNRRETSVSYR